MKPKGRSRLAVIRPLLEGLDDRLQVLSEGQLECRQRTKRMADSVDCGERATVVQSGAAAELGERLGQYLHIDLPAVNPDMI